MNAHLAPIPGRWPPLPAFPDGLIRRAATCVLSAAALLGLKPTPARGAAAPELIAVYSAASPAYARTRLPAGGFRTETYAFGDGGGGAGAAKDDTIDRLHFMDVARLLAPSLAAQAYVPCNPKDPAHTDLLIMVYWGATAGTEGRSSSPEYQIAQALQPPPLAPPPVAPTGMGAGADMVSDPSMSGRNAIFQQSAAVQDAATSALQQSLLLTSIANQQRDRRDAQNAALLGYLPDLQQTADDPGAPPNRRRTDLIDEVEESRYYVVLLAYDFQELWRHRQRKLLWETRFSIRERRNDFGRVLAAMAQEASRYFGRDSNGLVRDHLPETAVSVGPMKVLGYDSSGNKAAP